MSGGALPPCGAKASETKSLGRQPGKTGDTAERLVNRATSGVKPGMSVGALPTCGARLDTYDTYKQVKHPVPLSGE